MSEPSPRQSDASPDDERFAHSPPFFGTAALAFGAIVVCLAVADASGGLPFSLPRSWYTNRSLWYLLAIASFAAAWFLLKQNPGGEGERRPGSDARFDSVILYTRAGCHLCDEMRQLLDRYARYLPAIVERDIDADPELAVRFTDCVPVLEIDGKVRFRGRVNEILLRRMIDAAAPRAAAGGSLPSTTEPVA